MSEWLKEHAWKLTPAARADAHEIPPTHSRSTTSHNNEVHQSVPVNDRVAPGFRGVCDTVLTQFRIRLTWTRTGASRSVHSDLAAIAVSDRRSDSVAGPSLQALVVARCLAAA